MAVIVVMEHGQDLIPSDCEMIIEAQKQRHYISEVETLLSFYRTLYYVYMNYVMSKTVGDAKQDRRRVRRSVPTEHRGTKRGNLSLNF